MAELHVGVVFRQYQWLRQQVFPAVQINGTATHVSDRLAVSKRSVPWEIAVGRQGGLIETERKAGIQCLETVFSSRGVATEGGRGDTNGGRVFQRGRKGFMAKSGRVGVFDPSNQGGWGTMKWMLQGW